MKCLNGVAVIAAWGALAVGGLAVAQDADCNVNGIPDATEIAQGLVEDCNGNGIPDVCEYAGVMLEAEQSGFGNGNPLVATFTNLEPSISDVRLTIEVRADLDSVGEFVQVKVGGSVVTTLWVTGGQACPIEPQSQTVTFPAGTFNAALTKGTVVISLEPSGVVSVKECPTSSASVAAEYMSDLGPEDCLGTGVWDGCDIAADPSLDCDGNGLVDSCEIDSNPGLDCDANGIPDVCDLVDDLSLDCNTNGVLDACDISTDPLADCDGNGLLDTCEIASDPSLDCSGNGVLNSCELLLGGLYFDYDCDDDGQHDTCQINADPANDKNADGSLDSCQYARGDFDLDGMVGGSDLAVLLSLWGETTLPFGDLTGDGMIDGADLASLLGNWGEYSGPWGVVLEVAPDPNVITDPEWRDRIIATGLPWRVRDNVSQIELVLVPPGTFAMGCSASTQYGCTGGELPIHEVTLTRPFYLGRYEVTQAQWIAVMGYNESSYPGPNRPVEKVTWSSIQAFEAYTGLRLPTEAEWEYACRAGTTTAFSNGSDDDSTLGDIAWYGQQGGYHTHPVGQKQANHLGLHDMHGNVSEWCEDWYGGGYYAQSPAVDPPGPTKPNEFFSRILRGGNFVYSSASCRSSARGGIEQDARTQWLGFRAARTP